MRLPSPALFALAVVLGCAGEALPPPPPAQPTPIPPAPAARAAAPAAPCPEGPAPAPTTTLAQPPWTVGRPIPPDKPTVTVRPRMIQDVLVNPGMGIQTFQRFQGQALNPGYTDHNWSEAGPTARLPDPAEKPDFPDSSVAYLRWHWITLEPQKGKIRWDVLDMALAEARRHGQTLAIRLMPYDRDLRYPLPEWYRASGARRANKESDEKTGKIWEPDYTDPLYLKHWGEFIAAAGRRYDGHPDLDSVDIASIGYWGEGWSDYEPPVQTEKRLIDLYFKAFKETPLLVNDEPRIIDWAIAKRAGWRLDCWGDMRSAHGANFGHMLDTYPELVARPGVRDAWRRAPVSLETCGVVGDWLAAGWDVDYILEQALAWHATTVNLKSSAIPPEWRGKFEDFARRLGYRLALRRFEHPKQVKAGAAMTIKMWWQNVGVAPVYRPYSMALELRRAGGGAALMEVPLDVRALLPGDATWRGELVVPRKLDPGTYAVRLALLDPRTRAPTIRLAIEGREADGWYALSSLVVGPP